MTNRKLYLLKNSENGTILLVYIFVYLRIHRQTLESVVQQGLFHFRYQAEQNVMRNEQFQSMIRNQNVFSICCFYIITKPLSLYGPMNRCA